MQISLLVTPVTLLEVGSNLQSLVAREVEELQVAVEVPT